MSECTFNPVLVEDIQDLYENMRPEDFREVLRTGSQDVKSAIEKSVTASKEVFAVKLDEQLLALTGVAPFSLLSEGASPWLLTTALCRRHPRYLVKFTKPVVNRWLEHYIYLVNYVDYNYTEALRWSKWAGFTIYNPEPYGKIGNKFCKIEMRRD